MSRIWQNGFELQVIAAPEVISKSAAWTNQASSRDSGLRMMGMSSSGTDALTVPCVGATEAYYRMPSAYSAASSSVFYLFRLQSASGAILTLTSAGVVTVNTTNVGSVSPIPPLGAWNLLEVYLRIGSSGQITIRNNAVQIFSFSGNTDPGFGVPIQMVFGSVSGLGAISMSVDDIAINDTNGSVNNSWCGDGIIIALTPNADGDSSQWLGSDGNSVNNYLLVDELPHNSDTDYVSAASTGLIDEYNYASMPSIPAGSTITSVWVDATARRIDPATTSNLDVGVKSAATVDFAASQVLTMSYVDYRGKYYETDPADNASWTSAKINALQAAIRSS